MQLTPEQVKGRIKNVAKENKADARTLMRIYMMERFLERVANSQYNNSFPKHLRQPCKERRSFGVDVHHIVFSKRTVKSREE